MLTPVLLGYRSRTPIYRIKMQRARARGDFSDAEWKRTLVGAAKIRGSQGNEQLQPPGRWAVQHIRARAEPYTRLPNKDAFGS